VVDPKKRPPLGDGKDAKLSLRAIRMRTEQRPEESEEKSPSSSRVASFSYSKRKSSRERLSLSNVKDW
jgi:hypothetical protein